MCIRDRYESCTTGTSTFMPTINKLESLAPEAMFVDLSTADHIVFNTEMMERQLNFPYGLWTIGSGMEDPAFYDNVAPEAAELCFVQEDYDCWLGYKPYFDEVNEQCKAKLGYELTSCVACTYSATYVLHDVLERARYHSALDVYRSNILTAMQATDITLDKCVDKRTAPDGTEWCPALFKGIERVQFGEYGQNKYAHGMMSQILSGIHWPTYPTAVRPTDHPGVIFPIPAWSER